MKQLIIQSEQALSQAKDFLSTRKDDVSFNKIRFREKFNKTGVRKMKLHFDLTKEETEAFNNLLATIKPPEVATNDFVKAMFITGINTYLSLAERELANSKAADQEVSEMPNVEIVN